ncbi:MAG: ACT domain-containing protein [Proteobacteria bacterium]|nr:ACT domain-containing protein [Pseudomonadota bacterium]
MSDWVAVSIIGRDRPGIVASVSKVLFQNRCNIEDLSQTAIRGQFAMILIASTVVHFGGRIPAPITSINN